MIYVDGKPMCVDTPEVRAWLHSVGGVARVMGHHHIIRDTWGAQGLSMTPGPDAGVLYCPQGASRWSVGYFLAGQSQLPTSLSGYTEITLASDNQPDTSNGTQISFNGFFLEPIPLAGFDGAEDRLWLVTVVDWRYMLAKDAGDISSFEIRHRYREPSFQSLQDLSWSQLSRSMEDGYSQYLMDWSIPAANESASLKPCEESYLQAIKMPWRNFNLSFVSVGEMLDMIAANTGVVAVFEPTNGPNPNTEGIYHFVTWDESYTRLQDDIENHKKRRMAGGDCYHPNGLNTGAESSEKRKMAPKSIQWIFGTVEYGHGRQIDNTEIFPNVNTYFTLEESFGNPNRVVITDTAALLQDTFDGDNDHGSRAELESMAQMITDSIMARWRTRADYTFAGICHFRGNAYIDMIEYRVNYDRCYTRLHPIDPWAFRRTYQHATTEQPFPLPEGFSGVVDGSITDGYYPINVTGDHTSRNVPAFMFFSGTIDNTTKVWCQWNEIQKRYDITAADCEE